MPLTSAVSILVLIASAIVPLSPAYLNEDQQICECVAFRLDDVQDGFNSNSQYAIMNAFVTEKQELTVAIVGNVIGQKNDFTSKQVVQYIKDNPDYLILANHGYNHENFSNMEGLDQTTLMLKTNDKLYELFGRTADVFVPPDGIFNPQTNYAMSQAKISVLSGLRDNDVLYVDTGNHVSHIPANVEMSSYDNDAGQWIGIPESDVKKNMENAINSDGYALVVLRPNSIDADTTKIKDIIHFADNRDLSIVDLQYLSDFYNMQVPFDEQPRPNPEQPPVAVPGNTVTNVYNTTNVYQNSTTVTSSPAVLEDQYNQLIQSLQSLSASTMAQMNAIEDLKESQNQPAPPATNPPIPPSEQPAQPKPTNPLSTIKFPDWNITGGRNILIPIVVIAALAAIIIAVVLVNKRRSRRKVIKQAEQTKTTFTAKQKEQRQERTISDSDRKDWD